MKKLFALVLAAGILPVTHSALVLGDVIDAGDTITVGCMTFGDFGYATVNGPDASEITVLVDLTDYGSVLRFGGPMAAWDPGNSDVDIEIVYSLTVEPGCLIVGMDQAFNLSSQGAGGYVLIGETVFTDAIRDSVIGQSTVGYGISFDSDFVDPPGEDVQGDILEWLDDPQETVAVDKDIFLRAEENGAVAASTIYQSWHVVPEPAEYAVLAGLALLGFAGFRRLRG